MYLPSTSTSFTPVQSPEAVHVDRLQHVVCLALSAMTAATMVVEPHRVFLHLLITPSSLDGGGLPSAVCARVRRRGLVGVAHDGATSDGFPTGTYEDG